MELQRCKGKSLIQFPSSYIVLDLETTGLLPDEDEIIEISALRITDHVIADRFTSLARPTVSHAGITLNAVREMGFDSFSEVTQEMAAAYEQTHLIPDFITELTGITNQMLLEAPSQDQAVNGALDFIGSDIIVGQNVNFDINFLCDAAFAVGRTLSNDYVDMLRISKKIYPEMEHHRLSDMVNRLEVCQTEAHRAEADAVATYSCFEKLHGIVTETIGLDDFLQSFHHPARSDYNAGLKAVKASSGDIADGGPIFGKVVVFTGALSTMSRKEAYQIVLNHGGFPENTLTKKTNFLVVGETEFACSVINGKTNKMEKAEDYRAAGLDILTLSESQFFEMIEGG